MRVVYLVLILGLLAGPTFAQQFQKVSEGTSKAEVLKLLGNPTKKLVANDKSSECYIWIRKNDAWFVYFKDGKTTGSATNIETLLKGLMDLETSFSNLGSNEGSLTQSGNNDKQAGSSPKLTAREQAAKEQLQVEVWAFPGFVDSAICHSLTE